mgnify:CR=1 FL=1
MALLINQASPAGSDSPTLGDDQIRAFKLAVLDIFGIPDNTTITQAVMDVDSGGLAQVIFYDAAAVPASGELGRNGSPLYYRITDARTATTTRALGVIADTTGTPAASIGVGLLFQAESADESQSDFGAVDFVASDIGAGTEDTYMSIPLRVAGRALDEKYRFSSTAGDGFAALFTHAVTADRTYTLPDVTGGVLVSTTTGEYVQRATGGRTPTMGADETLGNNTSTAFTFVVAFSVTPVLLVSGLNTSQTRAVMYSAVSSTAFTPQFEGAAGAAIDCTVHYLALGAV